VLALYFALTVAPHRLQSRDAPAPRSTAEAAASQPRTEDLGLVLCETHEPVDVGKRTWKSSRRESCDAFMSVPNRPCRRPLFGASRAASTRPFSVTTQVLVPPGSS
jgi:hypothetical protein